LKTPDDPFCSARIASRSGTINDFLHFSFANGKPGSRKGSLHMAKIMERPRDDESGIAPAGFAGAWVLFIFLLIGFGFYFVL
jgi:hypothetical protein